MKHPHRHPWAGKRSISLIACAVLAWPPGPAQAQPLWPSSEGSDERQDLTDLSLEDLMAIEVTIASRSAQKLSDVPGAVYIITGDELRRSGHTTIQEALRMVPGFYVSNWTSAQWDVTSRGFGTGLGLSSLAYLNQLLVMIDGVVVYSPLFAGTWWGLLDVDLDDVDRIEVIRGPGGILWGSNAVHGVVHVITKSAHETQGPRFSARGQNDEWMASGRYGGRFGSTGAYRFYYRYGDRDGNDNPYLGFDQDWYLGTAGARFDWGAERRNTVWIRGHEGRFGNDGFDTVAGVPVPSTDEKYGFQVLGSSTSADGLGTLRAWLTYDDQYLETELDSQIITYDLEYQRAFVFSDRSRLSAGVGLRAIDSDLQGSDPFYISFDPEEETQFNYRLFLVQEWAATAALDFTLGAQLEYNHFTEWELQPTARVSWHPRDDLTLWSALTRSARTPSLEEVSLDQNSFFVGDPDFESEQATTFEIGVRKQVGPALILDLATFYNDYDDMHHEFDNGAGQFLLSNAAEGEAYGLELAADAQPTKRWKIRSAYSFIKSDFDRELPGNHLNTEEYHPEHQFNLRSYYDLAENVEFDAAVYVSEDFGSAYEIAERWRLDARLGWRPRPDLDVYVGAQQINDDVVSEYDQFDNRRRQFYAGLRWSPGPRE